MEVITEHAEVEKVSKFLLGATVATGFERTALEECREKLGSDINASVDRGRVFFEVDKTCLKKALELRTVDHLFVVVKRLKGLCLQQGKDESLNELCLHLNHSEWVHALSAWTHFRNVEFIPNLLDTDNKMSSVSNQDQPRTSSNEQESQILGSSNSDSSPTEALSSRNVSEDSHNFDSTPSPQPVPHPQSGSVPYQPTFRVTGHRVGHYHNFSSQEAAGKIGEYLINCYGWPVRMKDFDMEVLVNVNDNNATIGINLTQESMHKRNIVHFGPTTLRSTLAHCMLRLGEPQLGDVICDPMCGGGSIPIEGALNWPCYFLGGDNHDVACLHAGGNVTAINEKRRSTNRHGLPIDVLKWDVTNLPLRSNSVDLIVSDMPFGKRIGSRLNNWELYRRSLLEMGRVCQPGTGRAVLLTQDKKCMAKMLSKFTKVWKKQLQLTINIGGLAANVYILKMRGTAKAIEKTNLVDPEQQVSN